MSARILYSLPPITEEEKRILAEAAHVYVRLITAAKVVVEAEPEENSEDFREAVSDRS